MKLWEKENKINELIEEFTIGNDTDFDLILARYDVQGTIAHVKMLEHVGLLSMKELSVLLPALEEIRVLIKNGKFEIEQGVEDVHSQVEIMLTRSLGDVGKKIHTGRSRNDQVLVDLRLFFRDELQEVAQAIHDLFDILMLKSEEYKSILMPGYTHTQVAMVSSFGLWFSAYAESLIDDMTLLQSVYCINNQNPLGSAAGYGSSFPIDRQMTTELLHFDNLAFNSIHAQMGRGKTEQFIAFSLASISSTIGKLASDVILFSNENYRFLTLPSEFTTGSSIMPHKKNPDVFELIRGHSNLLQSLPTQVGMLNSNLISGYHREYQLLKEVLFPACSTVKKVLSLTSMCIPEMLIHNDILDDVKYKYVYTVEEVNKKVLSGMPFREAYHAVSKEVESDDFVFQEEIHHTHQGSIGNLCLNNIREKMNSVWESFSFN